jgi:hypothetical protein
LSRQTIALRAWPGRSASGWTLPHSEQALAEAMGAVGPAMSAKVASPNATSATAVICRCRRTIGLAIDATGAR